MRKPITKEQLEALTPNNRVDLIDVRTEQEYEKQHIPEAINIPSDELLTGSEGFSKTDVLVCICNHGRGRSQAAAEYLYTQGFENAFYLEGGTAGWFDE